MRSTERQQLVDQLIDVGRAVVDRGLVLASGGNLSSRLQDTGSFVVTGTGTWLDRLTPEDLAEVSLTGEHRAGARPSIEWKLHQLTYVARPDVHAIVHLHPQHVLLVDLLGQPVRFTTLDHQFYVGCAARIPFRPSGSDELAQLAAEAATTDEGRHAVILAHHGISALGDSVEMALRRAMNLEEAAQMTYRLLLAGNTEADFPAEYLDRIITA